jgi:peptidoglycan/xylan/chitin deacetylase (PgdA/CDA1 family)
MQLFILKNIKFYIFFFIFIFSENVIAEILDKSGANVFMYHRFDESKYPSTNIDTKELESHLMYLKENNFNIESIDEILNKKENKKPFLRNTVGFTVDDAFLSFYKNGWPIFKKYNAPVTLFVSTDIVNESHWNYMSWENLREFINQGGSIGLHSASHAHLTSYDILDVKKDLISSIQVIKKELGITPKIFAYPFGEASNDIINLLKSLKIDFAFGQHSGVIHQNSNEYYLPRFALNENYGKLERFIFSVNTKPLVVRNFLPKEIYLTDNKKPKIKFDVISKINKDSLNCFSNSGGKWGNIDFSINEKNQIKLNLIEPFLSGRGKINCTAKNNNNWLWFGHQFTVQ